MRVLTKPDGRPLYLYSRRPIPEGLVAPSPSASHSRPNPHMRWHPLRAEWVLYAEQRQNRTFLPPPEYNPLAPTTDPRHPTELPAGDYDVAVFENLFPTLALEANGPSPEQEGSQPARGVCEVVVFTQDVSQSLGALPLSHLELLIQVWAERYRALGAIPDVRYVMPFENRGVEVGVTLHHPHGQIYAYPFVPPLPARELESQRQYFETHARGLLDDGIRREVDDGRRILYVTETIVAFVPAWARYPYEVWVAPRRPAPSIADLDAYEQADLATALKTVLLKFDAFWDMPFPYVMIFHQAPTDGRAYPEAHFHIEFYPPYRMRGRLKYLAGSELGAGVFTADTLPEVTARELQGIRVNVE